MFWVLFALHHYSIYATAQLGSFLLTTRSYTIRAPMMTSQLISFVRGTQYWA